MARKKQEIALQTEIETQEEWEDMLSKEGLTVVDVYQEWCGPCKAMVSIFKRLKLELGDDLLRFAIAKADTVDALDSYRGSCKPVFLYFAGGVLVAVVRTANSPLLLNTINQQLAQEHKVLDGTAERKEIVDPDLDTKGKKEEEDEDEEEQVHISVTEKPKDVTIAIIKPNVVADGKVDDVITRIQEVGIEVLEQEERTLTEEEASTFYEAHQDKDYYQDLINFMTSGPSHILVLTKGDTGEGIIDEWRELIGPTLVEEAKESAPESLRAVFGKESYMNAVHGSDSQEQASRELAFFFPSFNVPTYKVETKVPAGKKKSKKPKRQRTLALVRPAVLHEKKDEILAKIEEAGFQIALHKEIQLTRKQAEEFYKDHKDQEYFETLVTNMTSGPVMALALVREDAVQAWRDMLGPAEVEKAKEEHPESLRAQFSVEGVEVNQLHGADSVEEAEKELEIFFPTKTLAVIKPDAAEKKEEIISKIEEAGFNIAQTKEEVMTQEMAEEFYKDQKDSEYYNELVEHMTSGPTTFLVLSKEDAVTGWRSVIGPTDPEKAKEEAPDSIRAQFGHDVKANAVHGPSDTFQAKEEFKLIFPDLKFEAIEEEEDSTASAEGEEEEKSEEQQQEGGEQQQYEEGGQQQQGEPEQQATQEGEGGGETQEAKAEEGEQGQEAVEQSLAGEDEQKTDDQGSGEQQQQEGEGQPAEQQEGQGQEEGQAEQQEGGEGQQTEEQAEVTQEGQQEEGGGEQTPAAAQDDEQAQQQEGGEQAAEQSTEESAPATQEETGGQEEAPAQQEEQSEQKAEETEGAKTEEQPAEPAETQEESGKTEEPAAAAGTEEQEQQPAAGETEEQKAAGDETKEEETKAEEQPAAAEAGAGDTLALAAD